MSLTQKSINSFAYLQQNDLCGCKIDTLISGLDIFCVRNWTFDEKNETNMTLQNKSEESV